MILKQRPARVDTSRMQRFMQRVAAVVDVGGTADAARLGRWLMIFEGMIVAGTGWWVERDGGAPFWAVGVGLTMVLVAAASARLPWHAWPTRAPLAYPLAAFVGLSVLGVVTPTASTAYIGLVTLWFMFVGVVAPVHSALLLLAPAVVTWVVMQGRLGPQQVVRVMLSSAIWIVLADVLAIQAANAKARTDNLAQQAETDPLTSLPNRRALQASLTSLAVGDVVVVIDIDHFKLINDSGGHEYGDTILVEFADTLASVVRGSDLVARYGGEEFVLVLPQDNQQGNGAASVMARLRGRWSQLHPDITWSAGASCHDVSTDPLLTLRAADRALYLAKASGRDRVVVSGEARALVGVATSTGS